MRLFNRALIISSALAIVMFMANQGQADVIYRVTVDTSPINTQLGYIDLQFNPGIDSLPATVAIRNFVTDGVLALTSDNLGGASGALPGPPDVTISNTDGFNDLFQQITFGNSIMFDAEFTGPALNPIAPLPFFGSVFALSLIDSDTVTPLLSTAFDGSLVRIDINQDGTTTATTYADSTGAFRATATLPSQVIPEPATLTLVGIGCLCLVGYRLATSWPYACRNADGWLGSRSC